MHRKKRFLILSALISLILLSGCVRLDQEVTVNEDGSGGLRFALGVETPYYEQVQEEIPEGYALGDLLSTLRQDELVRGVTEDHFEADGWTWDTIQLEIADIAALFAEERRVGPLRLSLEEGEEGIIFVQTVDLANSTLSIPGINLMDLTSAGYTVRLTAPEILDTNGVQEAAGVSVWEVSLGELLQEGENVTLRAAYSLEPYEGVFIPWESFFDVVVYGYLGLGILAILVVIIINTTGRRRGKRA